MNNERNSDYLDLNDFLSLEYSEILSLFKLRTYEEHTSNTKIDVLTKNSHQYKFYPVKGCLEFKVRATKDAHIAFTSGPQATEPITELIIGGWGNTKSVIRRNKKKLIKVEKETINILDSDDFRGFWVQWRGSTISVGHENETESFLSWTDPEPFPINFVGLYTGLGCTGSWKIEVPSHYATWQEADGGRVPADAVVGGLDSTGERIYVARAQHDGALLPGKLISSQRCAFVSWTKMEHRKSEYQVLVGGPNNWMPVSGSNIPSSAFPGGKAEDGEPLFIGRVHHEGCITTGMVQKTRGRCYISFAGRELDFTEYEILMP